MLVKWGYDSLVRPHLTVSAATIGSTQRDSADEFEPGGLTLEHTFTFTGTLVELLHFLQRAAME